jgi:hypothetical protein
MLHAPDSWPDLDDHLVEPEVTRDEVIGGRRVVSLPGERPHARQLSRLNFLLGGHLARGYQGACFLLTRFDLDSDFGTDACVYRKGIDPATGKRYLEELAFEVVSELDEQDFSMEKAAIMYRRGVRRIFRLFVEGRELCELSPDGQSWRQQPPGSHIEDRCFVTPLPIDAFFDPSAADNAVVEALAAKGTPAIRKREEAARCRGRAEAILIVLEARGLTVSADQRQEILDCRDVDRLDRWLGRVALASSADEVLAGD